MPSPVYPYPFRCNHSRRARQILRDLIRPHNDTRKQPGQPSTSRQLNPVRGPHLHFSLSRLNGSALPCFFLLLVRSSSVYSFVCLFPVRALPAFPVAQLRAASGLLLLRLQGPRSIEHLYPTSAFQGIQTRVREKKRPTPRFLARLFLAPHNGQQTRNS